MKKSGVAESERFNAETRGFKEEEETEGRQSGLQIPLGRESSHNNKSILAL